MKQRRFPASVLFAAICVLLIVGTGQSVNARENSPSKPGGAIFATGPADGGRLFIKRSPLLGLNVSIGLTIDGKSAGALVWKRTYDRYITPGRHILVASPSGPGGACQVVLDVRPGQTYAYSASYNVSKLILTPISPPR